MKPISIGYVTGHNFGGWVIPQKIQTAVIHSLAENNNLKISYNISEYLDSKNNSLLISRIKEDKKIKNIFFVSALQLHKNNKKFFKILNNFNLYFFLENIKIEKKQKIDNLIEYINQISNRKDKRFLKKNYTNLFFDFKKNFS